MTFIPSAVTTIGATKPLLVFAAASPSGHTGPMLYIAKILLSQGYQGIFMTVPSFKEAALKTGAGYWETTPFWTDEDLVTRLPLEYGLERLTFDLERLFLRAIPDRYHHITALLEDIRDRQPGREVIIVTETGAMAVVPWYFGAPLPRGYDERPKIIDINIFPLMVTSTDTGPFGTGLPPDGSKSGQARNKLLHQIFQNGPLKGLDDIQKDVLASVGCTTPRKDIPFFLDLWMSCCDVLLQLGGPSMEPPRSDLPSHIRCIGPMPKRALDPMMVYPDWWSELQENSKLEKDSKARKKIVLVSQGTVALNYSELIWPTMLAFSEHPEILVIAILGVRGATLPAEMTKPPNVRIVDYLSYDAILPYADVFVNNASYGGHMHSVNNGVPMVQAGETEDKFEVAALTEWAGFAVNLRTQKPSVEQVRDGVELVLKDAKYRLHASRLRQEGEDLDSMGIILRQIEKFTKVPGTG